MTQVFIQDKLTGEFYCVEMSEVNADGELTAGANDFPYWSTNKDEACNFRNELLAQHEMEMNDLTDDGARQPVIISQ